MKFAEELYAKATFKLAKDEEEAVMGAKNYYKDTLKPRLTEAAEKGWFWIKNPRLSNTKSEKYLLEMLRKDGFKVETQNTYHIYISWENCQEGE